MKKAIIILAIITASIALLFAQSPVETAPEGAVKAPAPAGVEKEVADAVVQTPDPVVAVKAVPSPWMTSISSSDTQPRSKSSGR